MDVSIGAGRGMKDKRDRLEAEGRSQDLVVFSLVRESKCAECNKELWRGDFLFKDGGRGGRPFQPRGQEIRTPGHFGF